MKDNFGFIIRQCPDCNNKCCEKIKVEKLELGKSDKTNDIISKEELEKIIEDLKKLPKTFYCPKHEWTFITGQTCIYCDREFEGKNMKTIKGLIQTMPYGESALQEFDYIDYEELKQDAIEDIKELESGIKQERLKQDKSEKYIQWLKGQIHYIYNKFNLT